MDLIFNDNSLNTSLLVRVSNDEMSANLTLYPDIDEELCIVDSIVSVLQEYGVKQGIRKTVIELMISHPYF